jgi:PAS domain S-box-containing protein
MNKINRQEANDEALVLFRTLIDQSNDAIEVLDPDTGIFLDANVKAWQELGYSREEFLKLTVFDIAPSISPSAFYGGRDEAGENGSRFFEGIHKRKDGSEFPVEVNLKYIQLDRNYIVTVVRDITERKLAEEALKRSSKNWQTTFDAIDDLILLMSPSHEIIEANKAALTILNKKREEVIGEKCYCLVHNSNSPITNCPCDASFKEKKVIVSEYTENNRIYELAAWPIFDENNEVKALTHIVKDITVRKQNEVRLRDSESSLRDAQEIANMGSWEWDLVTQKTHWSDNYFAIHGVKPSEVEPSFEFFRKRIHPDDVHFLDEMHAKIMKDKIPAIIELRIIQPNGTLKWIQNNVVPIIKDDKIVKLKGVIIDITERKQMISELQKSEEKFRTVFSKSQDAIFIHHIDGNFIEVNQLACESLEYTREELLNMGPKDIDDPENAKKVKERTVEISKEKAHYFETTQVSKSGKFINVEVNSVLIDYLGKPAILSITRDISERKKLTEELNRNMDIQKVINALMRFALDDIPINDLLRKALELIISIPWLAVEKKGAIFLTDENEVLEMQASFGLNKVVIDTCQFVSSGKCICGLALSTKNHIHTAEIDHRHDIMYPGMDDHGHYCVPIMFSDKVLGVINTYLAKGHSYSNTEMDFLKTVANSLASIIMRRKAENELRILNEKLEIRVIERTEELAGVNKQLKHELSQRRIVELELSKNVKFLSLLIETIPNPIFYKDAEGVFIDCNKAFADLMGKTKDKITGRTVYDLFPKGVAEIYTEKDNELIKNPGVQIYESKTNLDDKNFKDIISYKATFNNTDGSVAGLVGVIIGITRAKLVEEEIKANLDKEKELNMLKSHFIAVISHEFRTPLAGIQSSTQLLERYGHKWDETKKKEIFNDIYKSIRYTNMLLEDVSIIGRDDSGKLTFNVSLSKIEDICLFSINDVKAIYNNATSINFNITPKTISAIVDDSLLRHILNNLLSNSVKYSDPGSIVELKVQIVSGNIVFMVSDNGIGIPENDLKHIFETFHRASNVETIKGTGIGLAIVKRCVEMHNGTINIESNLNIGTTVTVSIPYIEKKSDIE